MVNVAGRSKGCSTCRRRRIKCDENRPVCGRCLRSGHECDGAKDITFVEAKIVKSRRSNKQVTSPIDNVSRNTMSGDYSGRGGRLNVPLKGIDFEIYICYIRKYLLRGGLVDSVLDDAKLSDVLTAGTSTTGNGQIFYQSVLSFATIFFGLQYGQAQVTDRGYSMHGLALKQLNHALSDSRCYIRNEVLLSVVTLALLECWVPSGNKHYLKHMLGLEKLFELRDPSQHCSLRSIQIYKGCRHMILFASLRSGQPSILAKPVWKRVLRTNCSDDELQEQDLFDVLADCTVLVAERNEMLEMVPESEDTIRYRDTLKLSSLDLLVYLHDWKNRWDSTAIHTPSDTSSFPTTPGVQESNGNNSPPFITVLEFSNIFPAAMFIFYNTVLIYVLRILSSLTPEDQSISYDQMNTSEYPVDLWRYTKDDFIAAERSAALEICRCLPYYLIQKSQMDLAPSPLIHLAGTTAWTTLRGNESAEGRWMTDLLNTKDLKIIAKGVWAG